MTRFFTVDRLTLRLLVYNRTCIVFGITYSMERAIQDISTIKRLYDPICLALLLENKHSKWYGQTFSFVTIRFESYGWYINFSLWIFYDLFFFRATTSIAMENCAALCLNCFNKSKFRIEIICKSMQMMEF